MDRCLFLFCCLFTWLPGVWLCAQTVPAAPVTFGQSDSAEEPLVEDATLHDVAFVDPEQGWAVGDRGAIWHTTDGGKNWLRQKSGVDVALHGVCFANRQLGWAVGGSTQPYLHTSQAVVLRTTDGGQTWKRELALLPALERVKFFDADHGVAWGRGAGGDPLGVSASDDSGHNWRPVAVGPQSAWWGGDFVSQHTGTVVGPGGNVVRITSGEAMPISLDDAGRNVRDIKFSAGATGWAVGEEGLILRTDNGGADWQSVDILPAEVNAAVDWQTISVQGTHVWIAGSPGTVVLHSPDAGESWQGFATGCNTPLKRITFVDETHGWAVGDFGTILHTSDGGQTWIEQRGGSNRAAVLMLLTDEDQLPLETLAKLSANGYRTVVHLLMPQEDSKSSTHQARLAEAMAFVGANSITQSAPCSRRASKTEKQERLLAEIVAQLRLWRPSVVVMPSGGNVGSWDELIAKSVPEAISQAADEESFPYLAEQLALKPWQTSRLFAQLPPNERGTHRVLSTDAAARTTNTLAEIGTSASSLMRSDFQPCTEANEFLLKASFAGEPTAAVDDLAAGLSITPGSDCRRPLAVLDVTFNPQAQRRLAEKRRNLKNIFRFAEGNPALLGQVGQMVADLDPTAAAALLFELSTYFEQAGQVELTSAVLELLARRYPDDRHVDQAIVWLVQYYASGETAHTYRQVTTEVTQAIATEEQAAERFRDGIKPATALTESEETSSDAPSLANRRYARAVQVAEHIAQTRPLLYSEPRVRVPWAVADRKLGTPESADRYLQSLAIRYPGESWQECGAVERWLTDRSKPAPAKPRVTCRFTGAKPKLDGQLDETFWQAKAVKLPTISTGPETEIRFAHDEAYFYLAIRCAKDPTLTYATDARARTYDADLRDQDRVRILIDVDRDYTTFFSLTVDHRGWTNDACWHDKSWNPKWFVATAGDAEHWNCEAAIPWSELTATPPTVGDAWALAAERISPSAEFEQQECSPADFGVLLFK